MNRPVILFACVHNGGRSLAAKVLAQHHGGGRVDVRSAGSEPGSALNPAVVQVLHERGLTTQERVRFPGHGGLDVLQEGRA